MKKYDNLMDTLALCEDDDQKRMILTKLSTIYNQTKELQIQLAIEESRKITITRRELMFFLKELQNGDMSDIKYRKTLIKTFVDKIYLYDDGRLTLILYNSDTTIEIETNLIYDIESDVPVPIEKECYFIGAVDPPIIVTTR